MTLYATIYDLIVKHLENPVLSRVDCYVRLDDGQLVVLTEVGRTGALSKKYDFEILTSDYSSTKGRPCKLIKTDHGFQFAKFMND